MRGSQGK